MMQGKMIADMIPKAKLFQNLSIDKELKIPVLNFLQRIIAG